MSKSEYAEELKRRLSELEGRVKKDRARLDRGDWDEKVDAAGDLATVERHLAETRQKLSDLEAAPEGRWEDFKTELEKDVGYLEDAFERWVENQV